MSDSVDTFSTDEAPAFGEDDAADVFAPPVVDTDVPGPFDPTEASDAVAEFEADDTEAVASDEDAPAAPDAGDEPARTRAAPTDLQGDMKRVTDRFVMGELDDYLGGKPLTPSRVSALVHEARGGEGKPPSTGAVAAAFRRWEEYGFATFGEAPYAFEDYTSEGRSLGLKGILSARKAERTASAPVEAEVEPEAEVATEPAVSDDASSAEPF